MHATRQTFDPSAHSRVEQYRQYERVLSTRGISPAGQPDSVQYGRTNAGSSVRMAGVIEQTYHRTAVSEAGWSVTESAFPAGQPDFRPVRHVNVLAGHGNRRPASRIPAPAVRERSQYAL
jgi:hypothetical protein